ncbi:MAG: hypothetical protein Kapaf2KO_15050 [Candidatus Kapaibacteriales bacterium]
MLKTFLLFISILALKNDLFSELVINEVLSNGGIEYIEGSDYDGDWVELYNTSPDPTTTSGYSIYDESLEDSPFDLPLVSVPGNGFLLLLANDEEGMYDGYISMPFKLSSGGERITLLRNDNIVNQIFVTELLEGVSYASIPDGSNSFEISYKPSPLSSNTLGDFLHLSHHSGFYDHTITLTVASEKGLEIRYTEDGSVPTKDSKLLPESGLLLQDASSKPNVFSEIPTTRPNETASTFIWKKPETNIEKAHILRFGSFKNNELIAEINASFFINKYALERFRIPMISMYTDPVNLFSDSIGIYVPGDIYKIDSLSGNFYMKGRQWEREVCFEYFSPEGDLILNQKAGLRTRGNTTRASIQKSLRLYARKEYGQGKFDFKFFEDNDTDEFEKLELANSISEWSAHSYIRNGILYKIASELNLDYPSFRPVAVFLNGEYWGLHTLRERIDEDFLSYYYNTDKEQINIASSVYAHVRHGNNYDYLDLQEYIKNNDLSQKDNYDYVSSILDIPNFIDYQILYNFSAIIDWPLNNYEHWNSVENSIKIRHLPLDGDSGYFTEDYNMFLHSTQDSVEGVWPNGSESTLLYRKLLENSEFKDLFISRYVEVLKTILTPENTKKIVNELSKQYYSEVKSHVRRFPFPPNRDIWLKNIEEIKDFLQIRPCFLESQIKDFFPSDIIDYDCEAYSVEMEDNHVLTPFPNPTSGSLHIDYNNSYLISHLFLVGSDGREIKNVPIEFDLDKIILDLSMLSRGFYTLVVVSINGISSSCAITKY